MSDDDLAELVAAAAGDIEGIVLRALPAVRVELSRPDGGVGLSDDDIVSALTAVLHEILRALGRESPSRIGGLDDVIYRRFEQGVALLDLLRNYRVGAAAIWEQIYKLVGNDTVASAALLAATPRVFEFIDHFSLRAHRIYRDLVVDGARRQEQIRAALLDTLLAGDPEQGASYWDAASTLGIPRQGLFLVLEATAPSTVATSIDWDRLYAGLADVESVWFRLGPRAQIGLVALRSGRAEASQLGRVLVQRTAGTIGLSAPFTSIADCRKARTQAATAAAATSPGRPVVQYDRDVLDVLMASSPDAAQTLVHATLGDILALPPERARILINNVRMWLDHNQSVAATASAMHCHRNTVNYRLRRFEEVTGRPLSDKTWLAQVYLAVNYDLAAR